jgi:hypothetical protein
MPPVRLVPLSEPGRSWWDAGIAGLESRLCCCLNTVQALGGEISGKGDLSGHSSRFNLGSFEGSKRKAILAVSDTAKTTYEFCLVWFVARRSIQLSYGRAVNLFYHDFIVSLAWAARCAVPSKSGPH